MGHPVICNWIKGWATGGAIKFCVSSAGYDPGRHWDTLRLKSLVRSVRKPQEVLIVSQFIVDTNLCKKDGVCVAVCPSNVLALGKEGFPEEVPDSHCILCGQCVAVCPHDALTHTGLPREEFLPADKKLLTPALMDSFLNNRRSVRLFKKKPIEKETLDALLDVARRAPTASNSQNVHWIVVNDPAKVHALSAKAIEWGRASGSSPAMVAMLAQWEAENDGVLRGAPTVIVACAPEEYGWGKQDCAIALTFMELAAEARGLGVCWAGILTHIAAIYPPLREALSVPAGYVVCGGLMLGERKVVYRLVPPRKPLRVQWL
jgi:nitroreductase/ferredoxin